MENRVLSNPNLSSSDIRTSDRTDPDLPAAYFGCVTKEVVSAFVGGDHHAFDIIYLRCFEPIRAFFCVILRNESLAEELCQEMFARLWERRHTIDPRFNFKSYLYTVAKTAALKHLRHRRVVERYEGFHRDDFGLDTGAPDGAIIADELEMAIRLAVEGMPHQRRMVFEMSRIEKLSNSEIAERLGIRESTVRAHLHNAVKELRELVTEVLFLFIFALNKIVFLG
jgi:RNA polymerase sigma-70 factor (ECF subfamily)